MSKKTEDDEDSVAHRLMEVDDVICLMFLRMPKPAEGWPLAERVRWLQVLESVLHMVYGPSDRIEILPLMERLKAMPPSNRVVESSAEPTDEAKARDDGAAGGSRDDAAETTEAPPKPAVGSERSSSAETTQDPLAHVEIDADSEPPRLNVGGRPSKDRPPHIPTNLAMAIEGIRANGPMTAVDLRTYVREKYWPGAPDHWAATLYDYVKARKLSRNERGLFDLPRPGEVPRSMPDARQLVKAPPPAAPKPAPPPKPFFAGVKFEHNGRTTKLPTSRAYVIAGKLLAVMGQPIGEAFLASSVFGSNTEKNRNDVVNICRGLNDPLSEVGLCIDYIKGVGFIMKDASA